MVTYSLKNPQSEIPVKKQKATPIVLTFHFQGTRLKMGIGESIKPADWNQVKRRPRASAPYSATLTKLLDRLESKIREIYLDLKSEFTTITPEVLRKEIERNINTGGKKQTFIQFFDQFITEKEPTTKEGTMQVYRSAVKLLKKFPGGKDFNDINAGWFVKYQSYLENYRDTETVKKKSDKDTVSFRTEGYGVNYISKNIAIIREVMTIAKKAGLHRNEAYKDSDYKRPHEDVESIYLSVDELMKIYNCELSPAMDRVRDRFLIGAFSGLRFSDSSKITLESVRDGLIFDRNTKTGKHVVIPTHWVIEEIFKKYPDGLPEPTSNQKTNEALKIIGDKAGINTPIIKRQTKGGRVITITLPKCKFITTHCARRSACTNMVLSGIPAQAVMKISGHTTESAFQKYIKASAEDSARTLVDHPFFTKPATPSPSPEAGQ